MKIAPDLYNSIKQDVISVCKSYQLNYSELTMRDMFGILNIISKNRAYDDSHPIFNGTNRRVLPYDGRDYCFFYVNGCNDDHVETALKKILKELHENEN